MCALITLTRLSSARRLPLRARASTPRPGIALRLARAQMPPSVSLIIRLMMLTGILLITALLVMLLLLPRLIPLLGLILAIALLLLPLLEVDPLQEIWRALLWFFLELFLSSE